MKNIKIYEEFFNDKQLESTFLLLKNRWKEEASFYSNPSDLYGNENYQKIISLGEKVIPILIKDLDSDDGNWIHALYKITGVNPIKEGNAGHMDKMINDWKNWHKENYA